MYIWILLATIMIALSFFNLSPRQDKDNTFSEIKAASLVTRFKVENLAVMRYLQCDTLLRLHTQEWDTRQSPPYKVDITNPNPFNFDYTSLTEVLPTGYKPNVVALDAKHYLYCMDRPVEESGAQNLEVCRFGSTIYPTYAVSFAEIPDRWLSKDGKKTPLPAFVNFLTDKAQFGGIAGYTECFADGTCALKGGNAHHIVANIDDATNKTGDIEVNLIARDSVLWQNAEFQSMCGYNKPCMFMYRMMPTTDEKAYCQRLLTDMWDEPPDNTDNIDNNDNKNN